MILLLLVAETLIVLHGGDKREIMISPMQVTSLRGPRYGEHDAIFTKDVKCMIGLTDGKFVTVIEDCNTVSQMIGGAK